ncbi:hypothetical protein [Desulfatibacillum aliphaticivorans]|uniref:hypothetical protein n=1 Tax=Desulfatibacillum aliphaticivorans TaxID=218208 RepID=UPI00040871FD|nr:hypothetical protein [Desulfatibacillum aliphaticivorans]
MSNKNRHLTDDLVLTSIVDYDDLPVQSREHLESCPACREQRELLMNSLYGLGDAARSFCPPAPSMPRAWESAPRASWLSFLFQPKPMFAIAGALASIVLALVLLPMQQPSVRNHSSGAPDIAAIETQVFMEDVYDIGENSLPPVFMDLAGETYTEWDQDFYDFLAPDADYEIISLGIDVKGALA